MYTLKLQLHHIDESEDFDVDVELSKNPDGTVGNIPQDEYGYSTYQSIVNNVTGILLNNPELNKITVTVE